MLEANVKISNSVGIIVWVGMGERDYVFTSQESHFMSPEQPSVHLANLRIVLFSVLTIELENFEAQMLSSSGKIHGLLYSA